MTYSAVPLTGRDLALEHGTQLGLSRAESTEVIGAFTPPPGSSERTPWHLIDLALFLRVDGQEWQPICQGCGNDLGPYVGSRCLDCLEAGE